MLDVDRLRRMAGEPSPQSAYGDAQLEAMLTDTVDRRGPDYNLVASQIWDEKAAALADNFDYDGDGSSLKRSQTFEHAQRMSRLYRSRSRSRIVRIRRVDAPTEDRPWTG